MHQLDEMKLRSVVEELESRVRALETLTSELRMEISSLRQHRHPIAKPIARPIGLPVDFDWQWRPGSNPYFIGDEWPFGMIG